MATPPKETTPLAPPKEGEPEKKDMESKDAPPWASIFGVGSAATIGISVALQMACGIGMSLSNKAVTNLIPAPCLVTIVQMVFTVLWLGAQIVTGEKGRHFGNKADVIRWCYGPPVFYGMQLAASMIGISKLSLAQQTNVRNLGPLITLPLERFITEPDSRVSLHTLTALGVITFGVALFFISDTGTGSSVDMAGVVWIVFNMFFAIGGRMLERRFLALEKLDVSITGTLFLNNVIGICPVAITGFFQGEFGKISVLPSTTSQGWLVLALTCVIGVGIGWTGLLIQRQVSATAMLTITNMNKFCVILIAMVIFGENSAAPVLVGCIIALCGGFYYGYASVRKKALAKGELPTEAEGSCQHSVCGAFDKEL